MIRGRFPIATRAKEAVSNDSSVGIVQFVQIEDSFVQFSPSPLVGAVGAQILLNLQQALASLRFHCAREIRHR
jgi:hypothetical protein